MKTMTLAGKDGRAPGSEIVPDDRLVAWRR
jgi:hypothetical protein